MPHPLDNPFWTALRELHGAFAQGAGEVMRYPSDIAPFVAIAHPGVAVDEALDSLLPDREPAVMLGVAPAALSPRWRLDPPEQLAQMTCDVRLPVPDGPPILPLLDATRQADARALTALVYPHYFRPRTMALGRYFGIYLPDDSGQARLAAMIGERLGGAGCRELSAICTHPGFTSRGLARRLTAWLANRLQDEGLQPFLHVSHGNLRARALYQGMGFRTRRDLPLWCIGRA